jgi:hypothetical protein
VRSTHDPKEFLQVQARMTTYANQSVPTRPQLRRAERLLEERGDNRAKAQAERAEFLASINLSETETWDYELRTDQGSDHRIRPAAPDDRAARRHPR